MDAHFGSAFGVDGIVEELEDFASKLHAWHGTRIARFGGVVSEAKFVAVGESADLEQSVVGQDRVRLNSGIVDLSDVDEIEDWSVSLSG